MKKFIYSLLAFMFVLPLALGLVACKNEEPKLKASDFVGEWYIETNVYTQGEESHTYTCARFVELHDKTDKTQAEIDEYDDLDVEIWMYRANDDGTLQKKHYYADESEYDAAGTWAIENNKFKAVVTEFSASEQTVEYKGGKIVVTHSRMWHEQLETTVLTLAKVR